MSYVAARAKIQLFRNNCGVNYLGITLDGNEAPFKNKLYKTKKFLSKELLLNICPLNPSEIEAILNQKPETPDFWLTNYLFEVLSSCGRLVAVAAVTVISPLEPIV